MKAHVIGNPVDHSLSPEIFKLLRKAYSLDLTYETRLVEEHELKSFLLECREDESWLGCNVTLPYKEKVRPLMDDEDQRAQRVGAVNVITREKFPKGARLRGSNSDVVGIQKSLAERQVELHGGHALILGTGGAARAALTALGEDGIGRLTVASRHREKAENLIEKAKEFFPAIEGYALDYTAFDEEIPSRRVDLVVNTTPLGMKGVGEDSPLPEAFFQKDWLSSDPLFFDLIYRPAETMFLKRARDKGYAVLNGLPMLIWQAIETCEIWLGELGEEKQKQELKEKLMKHLKTILDGSS